MPNAKNGDTVSVEYTGRLQDGTVFDASATGSPLQFTLGDGQLLPDFEKAVLGMEVGADKTFTIDAENAYGPFHQELIFRVGRDQFPTNIQPTVGQQLGVTLEDGQQMPVTIVEVAADSITLNANHPLAGQDLIFDIRLTAIQ